MKVRDRTPLSKEWKKKKGLLPSSGSSPFFTYANGLAEVTPHAAVRTGTAGFAGLRLVDGQSTTVIFLAVHAIDGCLRLGIIGHFHETKALGAAGVAVGDDPGRVNLAELREKFIEFCVGDCVAQVANIQILAHVSYWNSPIWNVVPIIAWIDLSRGQMKERSPMAQS